MIPAQCRAARALLDWSQQELAGAAGVGIVTVRQLEAGAAWPRNATTKLPMQGLEAAGVEFLAGNGAGPGVRLKRATNSLEQFLADLVLYERNRLLHPLGTPTHCRISAMCLFTDNREGANLMSRGQELGRVRWRGGAIEFDPPLPEPDRHQP